MQEMLSAASDVVQHAQGVKPAIASSAVGATAAVASTDWMAVIGTGVSIAGLMVAIASVYIGYLNYREKKRSNDLAEAKLGSNDNNQ